MAAVAVHFANNLQKDVQEMVNVVAERADLSACMNCGLFVTQGAYPARKMVFI
jgi:hypothetical protein